MKTKSLIALAIATLAATSLAAIAAEPPKMKMTTDIPASFTAPDEVQTSIGTLKYFDGVPTAETVESVTTTSTARGR